MKYKIPKLIQLLSAELPNLTTTFEAVAAMPPDKRVAWAKAQRATIFRDGWFINTPVGLQGEGETVQEHVEHLKQLIDRYLPSSFIERAKAYAECHDDAETIVHAVIGGIKRDLNPRFNEKSYRISDENKGEAEKLAADLIFENEPETQSLLLSYREKKDAAASLFSSLDKLCVMWRCVDFVQSGKYAYSDFQAYWNYWTPEKVSEKMPVLIADIYDRDVWPKAEALRLETR
ncbi:MAG TPA: hypothetical protein VIF12_04340 [Micavibrio sp.]|jgi:5'-deoxynucleotidase YfbR-like HD superfamily hydrolase